MGIVETIAISMGVAWASGINLYATLATLGILGATGNLALPPGLEVLADPMVITAAGLMYCVEFFADKVPGVDTAWDTLHTFIRIPAGAILAAGAIGDVSPAAEVAALIAGGVLATASHGVKSGTRVLINTSPEPFSNWGASVTEDVMVLAGLGAAIYQPTIFLALLAAFVVLAIWLMPKIWRGIRRVFGAVARLFGAKPSEPLPPSASFRDAFKPAAIGTHDGAAETPKLEGH